MVYIFFAFMIMLTVINLVIFHSIFSVFYTDLFKGIIKELVGAWLVAVIEASILIALWKKIAPLIIAFIVILVLVAAIVFIVRIIIKLSKKANKNNGTASTVNVQQPVVNDVKEVKSITDEISANRVINETSNENNTNPVLNNQQSEVQDENQTQFCVFCGKTISAYSKFCNHCGKENKRCLTKS